MPCTRDGEERLVQMMLNSYTQVRSQQYETFLVQRTDINVKIKQYHVNQTFFHLPYVL